MQELVLRDNRLRRIPDVRIYKSLVVFDVSFNEITSMNGLADVSNLLEELYVSKNGVTKIEELSHFHHLRILELGSNRLRVSSIPHHYLFSFSVAQKEVKEASGSRVDKA